MGQRLRSSILPFFIFALSAWALWKQVPQNLQELKSSYSVEASPPLAQIKPEFVNVITMGHKDIYDDFISIWLLQSLMDQRTKDADKLLHAIRDVIRHTPKLETTYMLSCFIMIDPFHRPDTCQEIIIAGLKAFPQSWRLPMTQAYVHYFILKQPAQAASFFMMAASRPKSPDYVRKLVNKLLKENSLTQDDISKSLDIMTQYGGNETLVRLLQGLEKASKGTQTLRESAPKLQE